MKKRIKCSLIFNPINRNLSNTRAPKSWHEKSTNPIKYSNALDKLPINWFSSPLQDSPSISHVLFPKGHGAKLPSSYHPSKTWWKGFHSVTTKHSIVHKITLIVPMYNSRSLNTMEGYTTERCHLGTRRNFTLISTPSSLRTKILLKGGVTLGP